MKELFEPIIEFKDHGLGRTYIPFPEEDIRHFAMAAGLERQRKDPCYAPRNDADAERTIYKNEWWSARQEEYADTDNRTPKAILGNITVRTHPPRHGTCHYYLVTIARLENDDGVYPGALAIVLNALASWIRVV